MKSASRGQNAEGYFAYYPGAQIRALEQGEALSGKGIVRFGVLKDPLAATWRVERRGARPADQGTHPAMQVWAMWARPGLQDRTTEESPGRIKALTSLTIPQGHPFPLFPDLRFLQS